MTAIEKKQKLIERIPHIEDEALLDTFISMLEENDNDVYILSDAQKAAIDVARQQVKKGKTIPHEEVMKKTEEWLNKWNGRK